MGHQPEDVARSVRDSGDIGDRTVRVVLVAEYDLTVRVELGEQLLVREVAPLAVLDGDGEALPGLGTGREGRIRPLDPHRHVATDERERRIRAQGTREQARLAQDLEA